MSPENLLDDGAEKKRRDKRKHLKWRKLTGLRGKSIKLYQTKKTVNWATTEVVKQPHFKLHGSISRKQTTVIIKLHGSEFYHFNF